MGFASAYLKERALFPRFIIEAPDIHTGIIVIIPAYNEPGICKLIDSLALCIEPECKIEVIIVINAPEDAPETNNENNRITINNIESWKKANSNCFFRLFTIVANNSSLSQWGVGLARKTGMDEAVRRFDSINNPGGIILNLDADCQVEKNYFKAVFDEFLNNSDRAACSIYFEHPLSGGEFPQEIYRYITLYELHLRYFYQGVSYSGFPYVFHTMGSALAVKALAYIKSGGMNRRQAGEDFYFIQKLVPGGGFFYLNSTTVYPSPRASSRVPFGTGTSIGKLTEKNLITLLTYDMQAFKELRSYFAILENIFHCSSQELPDCYKLLPKGLKLFINEKGWIEKIMEIKKNTSSLPSFKKRFFSWFNMFRIVKYLNKVHLNIFEKKPVEESASELLEDIGIIFKSKVPIDLLYHYRSMEKDF